MSAACYFRSGSENTEPMMERPVGIEPTMAGWKPAALPLGDGCETEAGREYQGEPGRRQSPSPDAHRRSTRRPGCYPVMEKISGAGASLLASDYLPTGTHRWGYVVCPFGRNFAGLNPCCRLNSARGTRLTTSRRRRAVIVTQGSAAATSAAWSRVRRSGTVWEISPPHRYCPATLRNRTVTNQISAN